MVNTPESSSNRRSPTSSPPSPAASGDSISPHFPPQSPSLPPTSSSSSSFPLDQMMPSDSVENSNSNTVAVVVAADKSSSDANDRNAGRSEKSAWRRPSNGVVLEAGAVMGADSWPALSESTNVSGKLQPDSSSSKVAAEGSSLSSSQAPVTSHSPQKQGHSNAKPNSAMNYNMPNRLRSMKRGGGNNIGSGPAQSSFSNPLPPPPPPFPVYQLHPGSYCIPDHSPRDHYRNNSWDTRPPAGGFVPAMNDHRGSSRSGNFARRDGSYHNNYGSRRDRDHGNYANTRDAPVHQPSPRMPPPRGLLRHPPPNTAGFIGPQPIRGPFPNHGGFPEFYYSPTPLFDYFKAMPFFTHAPPPALFFPAAESPLTSRIVNQIDYYFSDVNLAKDDFLKSNMDEQGWVPVALIAGFPRVRSLTNNIQVILDSMRASAVVEVQGDKLRRHNEWKTWLPSAKLQADSGSISPGVSRHNNLAPDFETKALENATKEEGPRESNNHSQLPNGDAAGNSNH